MGNKKYALCIGRWQPPHLSHEWLIRKVMKESGCPALVAVRDIPPDENNPLTTEETIELLEKIFEDDDVLVMAIPDIDSVNYGRGVGYGIIEHEPPEDVRFVSATNIRDSIKNDDDDWKKNVNVKIHDDLVRLLK